MTGKKIKIKISEEKHCNDLESLGSIFVPIIKEALSSEDLVEIDIMLHWEDIVGESISLYTLPTKAKYDIKNNKRILFIDVPVGGFALELQHKENYLLEKINSYFGYKAVHGIKISQNMNMSVKSKIRPVVENKLVRISKEDKQYLNELTDGIEDEKIKEILIKIGENVISTKKEGL